MFTALPRSVVVRVGALVLGAGVTRVRIKEFAAGVLIHTSLATVGFVMCDRAPGQAAPNAVVTITISMLALFAAYITERRERVSLLREHEAALSSHNWWPFGACSARLGGAQLGLSVHVSEKRSLEVSTFGRAERKVTEADADASVASLRRICREVRFHSARAQVEL